LSALNIARTTRRDKAAGGACRSLVAGITVSGFVKLPDSARHATAVTKLPAHNLDSFDRMLIAQVLDEPM